MKSDLLREILKCSASQPIGFHFSKLLPVVVMILFKNL